MRTAEITPRKRLDRPWNTPDLASQLEELLVEVWRQEDFERKHPFTCAVIRETSCIEARAREGRKPLDR